jgi:2-oxoglutarate ferredoxin oxidoreductase subunit beta
MAGLPGTAYSVRRSLHDAKQIIKAKKAIKTAFEMQLQGRGFSLVELLSTCPTNWGMKAGEACEWVRDVMIPTYPLGDFKVNGQNKGSKS